MSTVDVMGQLEKLAASNPQKLNWRTSIVDLLKLLGQDSTLGARKRLAQQLGYPGVPNGSAEMNIWLHQRVIEKYIQGRGSLDKALPAQSAS